MPSFLRGAATALERYKTVLDPPTDEWPVFPSAHAPSKYRAVREQLSQRDVPDDEIETILESDTSIRYSENTMSSPSNFDERSTQPDEAAL